MTLLDASDERSTARAPRDSTIADGAGNEISQLACALIASRQNVSPKRLVEPGPDAAQIETLFEAAAAAPDHGMLTPWRFVIVPQAKRELLGDVFARALVERDAGATLADIESAREKARRAPLLMLAVARFIPNSHGIRDVEIVVSLGCAIQNMLLSAHALGFGAGLTSGQAMSSPRMRELFALSADEQPVCFLNFGTVSRRKPLRTRPAPDAFTSTL